MREILIVGAFVLLLYLFSKANAPAPPVQPVAIDRPPAVPPGPRVVGYGPHPPNDDRQPDAFGYGRVVPDVVGRGDDINSVFVRSFR